MDFLFIILFISFLLTGLLSGFIAGLLGVGGGMIIVPISYFVLSYLGYSSNITVHIAIASSLGTIVFTSMSSIYTHIKLNNVDFSVIKKWGLGITFGSVFGSYLATMISGDYLILTFIFLILLLSINMFFNKNSFIISESIPKKTSINFILSSSVGSLSALIGIGGGSFSVPLLSAFSKSIHKAVGTSAFIGFFIALPGSITYAFLGKDTVGLPPYSIGYVNLTIVFLVSITSIFSANIGAKYSSKTKKLTLKKIFAVFLLFTCISLVIENFIF